MDLQEFKSRIDIVRIIENYLILRKEGAFYKANCPFHAEKTASFIININKGYWHCFGCGKGGDAIKFLQDYKNLSFAEAVAEVAKLENIELNFNSTQKEEFGFLKELNEYFKNNFNEESLAFCKKRGLDESDIGEFELGYTEDLENLLRFLKAKNYINIAKKLGYIKENQKGFYSLFVGRLSFVIKDSFGRVRGFSTRELKAGGKLGKYVNSLNSELFNKSFLLYGFDKAKDYARLSKKLYLCEGFFDAIALQKAGFKSAVACLGTAFTHSHLSLIKRLNVENLELVFVPDKDKAGYEAVNKALWLCFENEFFNLKVALCKKNVKDVGEFMQKYDIKSLALHTYEGLEFYIKFAMQKAQNSEAKHALFIKLKKMIESVSNFYLKKELFSKAASYLNIDESEFLKAKKTFKNDMENQRQILQIIKSALNDEDFKERLIYYAGEFLDRAFFNDEGKKRELLADENVKIYAKERQNEALKAFVLSNLYKQKESEREPLRLKELASKIAQIKSEV
ncbi:DNA primase [Campylobacter felis]|uniref:DNA primase n=1 Tax=Campylobacter felis TaxID=2974565 RepID=UPI0025606D9E|nr:DNA primase [Campylobacter felis]